MKPRNFSGRKLRRQLLADHRAGFDLTEQQRSFVIQPIDTWIRMGRAQRAEMTAPL